MSTFKQVDNLQIGRWISLKAYWIKEKYELNSEGLNVYDTYILAPLKNITKISQKTQKLLLCELLVVEFQSDPQQSLSLVIKNQLQLDNVNPNNKTIAKLEIIQQKSNKNSSIKECFLHLIHLLKSDNSKQTKTQEKRHLQDKIQSGNIQEIKKVEKAEVNQKQRVKIINKVNSQQNIKQKGSKCKEIKDNNQNIIVPLPQQISELQEQIRNQKILQKPTVRLKQLMHTLAIKNHQNGNYDESQRIGKQLVPICMRLYGKHSKQHSQALQILGSSNLKLFQYDTALENYDKALKISKQLKDNGQQLSRIAYNLGSIYHDKKDLKKAEQFYHQSISIITKLHGNKHLSLAYTINSIANILKARQQFIQAQKKYQQALQIFESHYGRCYFECAVILQNLIMCQFHLGKYEQFIDGYHEIFTVMKILQLWNHIRNIKYFIPNCQMHIVSMIENKQIKKGIYIKILKMLSSIFEKQYQDQKISILKYHLDKKIRMQ